MPAKRFNEADIDFDETASWRNLSRRSLTELDRLRKRLVKQQAKGVTVVQMHEVLKSGGIDITERSCGRFWTRAYCREGRLPRPRGPWCRKKAVIRSEPNGGACEFAKQGSGIRRMAVRRGDFRDADNEVAMMPLAGEAPTYGGGAKRRADRRRCIVRRTRSRQRA